MKKIARCSNCEYLHANGNCLKVGGFFSTIEDKDCPKTALGLLQKCAEEIENLYGRETELTRQVRNFINNQHNI